MIRSFRSKELSRLWAGERTRIHAKFHARILRRLDVLSVARKVEDLDMPGFNFHVLRGFRETRYSIHVNGPWCITFRFIQAMPLMSILNNIIRTRA